MCTLWTSVQLHVRYLMCFVRIGVDNVSVKHDSVACTTHCMYDPLQLVDYVIFSVATYPPWPLVVSVIMIFFCIS